MKPKFKILVLTAISVLFIISSSVYSQNRNGNLRYQNELWNLWSFDINAGLSSFYGDLSSFDNNFLKKQLHESGPAFGLILTKHFDRLFGVSGQLLLGQLKGNIQNSSFNAGFIEYNLHARFNLLNLFFPDNKGKIGLNIQAGIGQFLFQSTNCIYNEGANSTTMYSTRVPEFIYFFGSGFFYRSSDNFGISLNLSVRQCHNDMLDVVAKNSDYDYYSYMGVGFTYYLSQFKKGPVKNKARIANSDRKLKHLSD
jgi:hypothetical protein